MDRLETLLQALRETVADQAGEIERLARLVTPDFNSTGWTHTGHVTGATPITTTQYRTGYNSPSQWLWNCSAVEAAGFTEMALVMGQVVDYFKPRNGSTACQMLTNNSKHQWRPNTSTAWIQPAYFVGLPVGGSSTGWPRDQGFDQRIYLSFWGGGEPATIPGGCCSLAKRQPLTASSTDPQKFWWGQPFDLYWR